MSENEARVCPFALRQISVLPERALGHFRYGLESMPPQPNSLSEKGFTTIISHIKGWPKDHPSYIW